MTIRGKLNLLPYIAPQYQTVEEVNPNSDKLFIFKVASDFNTSNEKERVAFISGGDRIHYVDQGGYDRLSVVGNRYYFVRFLQPGETVTISNAY